MNEIIKKLDRMAKHRKECYMVSAKVCSESEIAQIYGVSKWTVRRWRLEGELAFIRCGHRILYRVETVEKWLAEREAASIAKPEAGQFGAIRVVR